jgi:hypothetical protein
VQPPSLQATEAVSVKIALNEQPHKKVKMTERTPHSNRNSLSSDDINLEAQSHHSQNDRHNRSRSNSHNRSHRNSSTVTAPLDKQITTASGISVFEQRAQSVISRIRSREPGQTAKYTHALSHTKTTEDAIVDFEGADDPYRPLNWGFRKKAVTTVLYGLTTMGMLFFRFGFWCG